MNTKAARLMGVSMIALLLFAAMMPVLSRPTQIASSLEQVASSLTWNQAQQTMMLDEAIMALEVSEEQVLDAPIPEGDSSDSNHKGEGFNASHVIITTTYYCSIWFHLRDPLDQNKSFEDGLKKKSPCNFSDVVTVLIRLAQSALVGGMGAEGIRNFLQYEGPLLIRQLQFTQGVGKMFLEAIALP